MPLLAICALAGGYGLRWLHERHVRQGRERVIRALGGELPDWELDARQLEKAAQAALLQRGDAPSAWDYQREADKVRKRGRRRDREWR